VLRDRTLIEQCDIPVFHDDQHGTAIVTAAGMINALEIAGKTLPDAKIVCLGAGAAAISCMKLLVSMGAKVENIFMVDRTGVIHSGRDDLNQYKAVSPTRPTSAPWLTPWTVPTCSSVCPARTC
jgi:malate dehydrogenase (oxaloacetate-decarboxylating)(NADP+)